MKETDGDYLFPAHSLKEGEIIDEDLGVNGQIFRYY